MEELDLIDEIDRLLAIEPGSTWREKDRKSRKVTVIAVSRALNHVRVMGFRMEWHMHIMEFYAKYERVHKR